MASSYVHPFPARMAPDIAFQAISNLESDAIVVDPMCGSGTVLTTAINMGLNAVGIDVDPLAVLMSKVATTKLEDNRVLSSAQKLVRDAQLIRTSEIPAWIDAETERFIRFWFDRQQRIDLTSLASSIINRKGPIVRLLRLAMSRTIITKDSGASLGRDISHSRPHRVRENNDYDVYAGFVKAVNTLVRLYPTGETRGVASITNADFRRTTFVKNNSVDCLITSPPYFNAIDYLRGHKLSLVWLGYNLSDIRRIRTNSVGVERQLHRGKNFRTAKSFVTESIDIDCIPAHMMNKIVRFSRDMMSLMEWTARVLTPTGSATFVVADSQLRGVKLDNAELIKLAAEYAGMKLAAVRNRELPASRRYLPPPKMDGVNALDSRMKNETVLTFAF